MLATHTRLEAKHKQKLLTGPLWGLKAVEGNMQCEKHKAEFTVIDIPDCNPGSSITCIYTFMVLNLIHDGIKKFSFLFFLNLTCSNL